MDEKIAVKCAQAQGSKHQLLIFRVAHCFAQIAVQNRTLSMLLKILQIAQLVLYRAFFAWCACLVFCVNFAILCCVQCAFAMCSSVSYCVVNISADKRRGQVHALHCVH